MLTETVAHTDGQMLPILKYRSNRVCQDYSKSKAGHFFEKWCKFPKLKQTQLEMWANAQRDGRPAEHRWRPLFNAAKFGWRPLLHAVQ